MLQARNLSKAYGGHQVLKGVSFVVNRGERLAVIGPNGAGKTTLLRILAGLERPDEGEVALSPPALRLGYLPQGYAGAEDLTVEDAFPELARLFALGHLERRLALLAEALAHAPPERSAPLADDYAAALAELESARRDLDLSGMAPLPTAWDRQIDTRRRLDSLSGGEQTRLGLSRLVLGRPDLLLVDEPSNHLDIEGLEWLEAFLSRFRGALVFVTHDRALLEALATSVLDVQGPAQHRLFAGGYSDYLATRHREREEQEAAYGRQRRRVRRVKDHVRQLKERALRVELSTTNFYYRKRAAKVARQAVVVERRLQRFLESEERIEKPVKGYPLRPGLAAPGRSGDLVVSLEDVSVGFERRPLLRDVSFELCHGQRAALVGPNGSGKTTLLRLIAGELAPSAGRVRLGRSVRLGFLEQGKEGLDPAVTPVETVRLLKPMAEAEARRFLHHYLFSGDEALTPIDRLSYGQRARLALARLVLQGASFLMLDEPTNFLDILSREEFEGALAAFTGTVLVVTHDRHFIGRFPEVVLTIEGGTVRRYT